MKANKSPIPGALPVEIYKLTFEVVTEKITEISKKYTKKMEDTKSGIQKTETIGK